jgi:RimJ/RimL family protein N-acetyltransferase
MEGVTIPDRTPDRSLWRLADLVTPMAIRVAATLHVADHVADGRTAAEIAAAEGVDREALDRLLRHLVVAGLLRTEAPGRYALTPLGEQLRDAGPTGVRASLDLEGALGRADLAFTRLLDAVRTGRASYPLVFGGEFWSDLAADAGRTSSYDAQMGVDVAAWAPAVVGALDWGAFGRIVDVGGGNGTLLIALLRAYPTLRGTVLDQPATVDAARAALADAGVIDRADVHAGSFFDPLPPGADAYVLSAILHDWDDEHATLIVGRCAEAAGADGVVIVVEKTGPDGASPSTAMDLRMLAYFGGRERGVAELCELADSVGLALAGEHRGGDLSILEFSACPPDQMSAAGRTAPDIRLEPWREDDLPLITEIMGTAEMTVYLGGPETPEKLAARLARYRAAIVPEGRMFKVVDAATGEGVGSVGYWERVERGETVYETGWHVLPAFQGRGIAARATHLAIEAARSERRNRYLHAYPRVDNGPSNGLCRKLGFTLLGSRAFEYPPGNPILCNDWRLDLFAHESGQGSAFGADAGGSGG